MWVGRLLSSNINRHKNYSDYLLQFWGNTSFTTFPNCAGGAGHGAVLQRAAHPLLRGSLLLLLLRGDVCRGQGRVHDIPGVLLHCNVWHHHSYLHLFWISHSPIYLHDELSDVRNQSPSICRNFWINFLSEHFLPRATNRKFSLNEKTCEVKKCWQ